MSINYGVVGRAWRFRDGSGRIWEFTGAHVSTPAGARPGSYWVESDGFHYIDEFGDERRIYGPSYGTKPGRPGSYWVESSFWAWLDELAAKHLSHDDVAHSDTHGDVLHSDSHSDTPHGDSHGDVLHSDVSHGDRAAYSDHGDVPHEDIAHSDAGGHTDHSDSHGDSAHIDHSDYFDHSDHSDTGCLRAGTLIAVFNENGDGIEQWPVERLVPGMLLCDYDLMEGRLVATRLVELRDVGTKDSHLCIIVNGAPPVHVTPEQPFDVLVPVDGRWTLQTLRAEDIRPGWALIRPLDREGIRYCTVLAVYTVQEPGARFYWPVTESGGYIANGYLDPVKS